MVPGQGAPSQVGQNMEGLLAALTYIASSLEHVGVGGMVGGAITVVGLRLDRGGGHVPLCELCGAVGSPGG